MVICVKKNIHVPNKHSRPPNKNIHVKKVLLFP